MISLRGKQVNPGALCEVRGADQSGLCIGPPSRLIPKQGQLHRAPELCPLPLQGSFSCAVSGYCLGDDKVLLGVATNNKTLSWARFERGEGRYKPSPAPGTFAPRNCTASDSESRVHHRNSEPRGERRERWILLYSFQEKTHSKENVALQLPLPSAHHRDTDPLLPGRGVSHNHQSAGRSHFACAVAGRL